MPRYAQRPFGNEVTLQPGDTVFWDNRDGWRGTVTAVHSDGTLDVTYDCGEGDIRISAELFTVPAEPDGLAD